MEQSFIEKWAGSEENERANYQTFLNEWCDYLGVEKSPPKGKGNNHYCFDRDVKIIAPSGAVTTNYIDFYKEGCFVLEAKQGSDSSRKGTGKRGTAGYRKAMKQAFYQALWYARFVESKPPFLITCDIGDHFRVWQDFSESWLSANGNYGTHDNNADVESDSIKSTSLILSNKVQQNLAFNSGLATEIAQSKCEDRCELTLVRQFTEICTFLSEFPEQLSWKTSKQNPTKPSLDTREGLETLASCYFSAYRRSDFPTEPSTVPDDMVSFIMEKAYGYSAQKCQEIKVEHQHSMCAENCVGNLLERYLHETLKYQGWSWCCGDFVKAIDFIRMEEDGRWILLQIKNRDNSENSSSSVIRDSTNIQKWFRSFSKDTKKGRDSFTRWDKLPPAMQGFNLSEEGFRRFVESYLESEKVKLESGKADH